MKSFLGIFSFVIIGLLTAWFIGFSTELTAGSKPVDEEQNGFKQRVIIKFSHVVAENTPKGLAAEKFAQLVKEKTNDQVEVQVFPNGILYSDKEEFKALARGDIQMIAPAFSNLSNVIPEWLAFDLPFAYPDQNTIHRVFDGEIGKVLFQTLEQKNMQGLAFWSNGFKQMSSNQHPLLRPADFTGHTFRILPSKALESQFKLLGAKTVAMPFTEVYHNIESGYVNGQENTISNIFTKHLYQVQPYITISNHGYLGYAVIVNKDFWEKLEPHTRDLLTEALLETTAWNRQQAIEMDKQQLALLRRKKSVFIQTLTPAQKETWIRVLQPIYKQFEAPIGKELMQKIADLQVQK
ncbi:DctP family TRAP transporter solute-binding subunit [Brevibacillus laterosporus]|uniref:DctP family TRAP transporter solute-binding subunit n=1 Tax=Brevibacillus laterosporus TaxID=1465 RepID=A0A518VAC0_BRELA|nr:DctP family TRAP transporter solute-binding subunit [Brevibacillus laterosporus]